MATAGNLRNIALALEGTTETPHFDRAAFRVARIYATLAPDGKTANLKFLPEEQQLRIEMMAGGARPVPGKWGEQGWTTVTLCQVSKEVLAEALRSAWSLAQPAPKRPRRK